MKKYLTPFLNWRVLVLAALAMAALFLIMGETEDISLLLLTKAAGFGCGYACYRLGNRWDRQGLIDELNKLSEGI